MVLTILLKYWREMIIVIALASAGYLAYNSLGNHFRAQEAARYEQKFKEYSDTVSKHIEDVQNTGNVIVIQNDQKAKELDAKLNQVLIASKNKPLTTIANDGKCTLSPNFIDSYNSLVNARNSK